VLYWEHPDGLIRHRWVKARTSVEFTRLAQIVAHRIGGFAKGQRGRMNDESCSGRAKYQPHRNVDDRRVVVLPDENRVYVAYNLVIRIAKSENAERPS
jgi:hypothetical protein